LDSDKWDIIDDYAFKRSPDDIEAGREERRQSFAKFEQASASLSILWQDAKYWSGLAGIAAFIVSIVWLVSVRLFGSDANYAGDIVIRIDCVAFAIIALVFYAPDIAQMLPVDWNKIGPFNDPLLENPKGYLRDQATLKGDLFTQDGKFADRNILLRPWALLFLTNNCDLYALPRMNGPRGTVLRYAAGLALRRPVVPTVTNVHANATQLNLYVDQRTTVTTYVSLTEVLNHYHFVTQIRKDVARYAKPPKSEKKETDPRKGKSRWPCAFDVDEYEGRLLIFKRDILPKHDKVESHQIDKYVAAIDGARAHWAKHARTPIAKLAAKLGPIIAKRTNGSVGLGESDSPAWIRSLIGGTGQYAFVRELFESDKCAPQQSDPVQYRLI
jgi:hypothetical protein